MDSPEDDRIAELLAAAAADDLTPAEAAELEALRTAHPWIDGELAELQEVARRLSGSTVTWAEVDADDALRDRVLAQTPDAPAAAGAVGAVGAAPIPIAGRAAARRTPAGRRRSRRWVAPMVGAACLVVGLAVGSALPGLVSAPPTGGPGTLGAIEQLEVRDQAAGAQVEADLVAHTWGTEAILDATGLDVGATYSVVLIGSDGAEFPAGEMLGSDVPIHCRLNAAVLRQDAVRLEIREQGETAPTAVADLPEV